MESEYRNRAISILRRCRMWFFAFFLFPFETELVEQPEIFARFGAWADPHG